MSEPESLKKQVAQNLASNYAMTAIGMALGVILVPFMIWKLGAESFGLVSMVESLVLMYELVTVSVRQALSRHATYSLSDGKQEEFVEYLSTGRVLLFVSSAIVLAVGVTVSVFFTALFRVPAGQEDSARWLFFFMTLAFVASIPNAVYWAVLYAKQRFDLINSATSAAIIIRAALLFGWFSWAPTGWAGLTAYGVIYCVVMLSDNFVVYLWHRQVMPGLRLGLAHFRRARVREIVSYSFHTSLARLSTILVSNVIQVCLNVLWGPSMNAYYAVAMKIPNYLRKIFVEPIWTLTPTFTKLAAENDRTRIERLLISFSKLVSIVTIPACLFFITFSRPVMRLWVGPGFEMSADLMQLYVIPMIFGMQLAVASCLPSAFGKVKVPSLVGVLASILNAAAGFVLATVFHMGLFGFAWANFFTGLSYITFFSAAYACRIARISIRRFLIEAVLRPFFLALIVWGGVFGAWNYFFQTNPLTLLLVGVLALCTVLYAWICVRFVLSVDERRIAREVLTQFGLRTNGLAGL